MKNIKQIVTLVIGLTTAFSCKKDDIDLKQAEGYIVGFDPCTINHHYRIGYVIITADLKDTLITYNLSDNTYKMPASVMCSTSDTIYKIPEGYFSNFRNSAYFPKSVQYEFKIKLVFTKANENEMVFNVCTHDINQADFNNAKQVIIKSATK
ncbi:MAG: hypothetical protein EHM93_19925 [Bacteroidales bacterium]|nr:MAG: hypothetical protein EHM93_19925 [Bacteroidales bacterium]